MRPAILLLVSFLCAAGLSRASWSAGQIPIGVGDLLRITVYDRPDLTGDFRVRPPGVISYPLLGEVPAGGLSPADLERTLTERLTSLQTLDPRVTTEVVEYRSFYVDGDIARPGGYPYRPGLTVAAAIALAGSRFSTKSGGAFSLVEQSRERESLDALIDAYSVLVAEEARLLAERDALETVTFPDGFAGTRADPRLAEIAASQVHLFETRRAAVAGQVSLLEQRVVQLEEAVGALEGQASTIRKKLGLWRKHVASMKTLAKKGVHPKSEIVLLEIRETELQRELRQAEVLVLEAEGAKIEARQSIANLESQRASGVASRLAQVRVDLAQDRIRILALERRIALMYGARPADAAPDPVFRIRRDQGEGWRTFEVDGDSAVMPGDVLEIAFPDPADLDGLGQRLPPRVGKTP